MKDEFIKIYKPSLYEIDVNEFEDALTLKTWWSLWIIEKNASSWKCTCDTSKLIDESVCMFYEPWTHDMNDM